MAELKYREVIQGVEWAWVHEDERRLGFAMVMWDGGPYHVETKPDISITPGIGEIKIYEDYRKQGYGKFLLDGIIARAHEKQVDELVGIANVTNRAIMGLYRSAGFNVDTNTTVEYSNTRTRSVASELVIVRKKIDDPTGTTQRT